jgi:hypothetical protein
MFTVQRYSSLSKNYQIPVANATGSVVPPFSTGYDGVSFNFPATPDGMEQYLISSQPHIGGVTLQTWDNDLRDYEYP